MCIYKGFQYKKFYSYQETAHKTSYPGALGDMSVSSYQQQSQDSRSMVDETVFLFGTQAAGVIEEWQMEKEKEDKTNEKNMALKKFVFDGSHASETPSQPSSGVPQNKKKRSRTPTDVKEKSSKTKKVTKRAKKILNDSLAHENPGNSLDVFSLIASNKAKVKEVSRALKKQDQAKLKNKQRKEKVFSRFANVLYSENDWEEVRSSLASRYLKSVSKSQITLESVLERQEKIINSHPSDSIFYNSIQLPKSFDKEDFEALYDLKSDILTRNFLDYSQEVGLGGDHQRPISQSDEEDNDSNNLSHISDSDSEDIELNEENMQSLVELANLIRMGKNDKRKIESNMRASLNEDHQNFDFDFIDSIQKEKVDKVSMGDEVSVQLGQLAEYEFNIPRNDSSMFRDLQNMTEAADTHSGHGKPSQMGGCTQEDPVLIISSSQNDEKALENTRRSSDRRMLAGTSAIHSNLVSKPTSMDSTNKIQVLESVYQNSAQLTSFKIQQMNDMQEKTNENEQKNDSTAKRNDKLEPGADENQSDTSLKIQNRSYIAGTMKSPCRDDRQDARSYEVITTSSPILRPEEDTDYTEDRQEKDTLSVNYDLLAKEVDGDETHLTYGTIDQLPDMTRSRTVERHNEICEETLPKKETFFDVIDVDEISNSSADSDNDDWTLDKVIAELNKDRALKSSMNTQSKADDGNITRSSIPDSIYDEVYDVSLIQVLSSQENKSAESILIDNEVGLHNKSGTEAVEHDVGNDNSSNPEFFSANAFDFGSRREKISGLAKFERSQPLDREPEREVNQSADSTNKFLYDKEELPSGPEKDQEDDEDLQSQLNFESYSTTQLKAQMNEWGLKPVKSRQAMINVLKSTSNLIDKAFLRQSISQRNLISETQSQTQTQTQTQSGTQSQGASQKSNEGGGFLLRFSEAQLTEGEVNYKRDLESANIIKRTRITKVKDVLKNDKETYLNILLFQPLNLSVVLELINVKNELNIDQALLCEILTELGICYTETEQKMNQSQGIPDSDIAENVDERSDVDQGLSEEN